QTSWTPSATLVVTLGMCRPGFLEPRAALSAALFEPVSEVLGEPIDLRHALDGLVEVVLDAPEENALAVEEGVARARVAVARLAAGRAMDVLHSLPVVGVDGEREVAQELPARVAELRLVGLEVELLARPVDRHLRLRVEPDGAVEDGLLVVAEERELELRARDVDA